MLIRIPGTGAVAGLVRSTAGWAAESVSSVAGIPGRLIGLVDGVESLVGRVHEVVDRAEELVARTAATVDNAEKVVRDCETVALEAAETVRSASTVSSVATEVVVEAKEVCAQASGTVVKAQQTAETADTLLEAYAPTARRAAPLAERFVEELSANEVEAAIRLVDELPVLTEHLLSDVLPILKTLDRVGPEIHELLEVTHDVRRAIVGIPGFQFFRRRGEDRVTEEESKPNGEHFPR